MKKTGKKVSTSYEEIHMPKGTALGLYIGVLSFFLGFGAIWYMFPLVYASGAAIIGCLIVRFYQTDVDYHVPVSVITAIERGRS
jgi:cytochrome o ubiquinol oxidase subunit 1